MDSAPCGWEVCWGGAYRGDFSLAIAEDHVENLARFLFLRTRLTGGGTNACR